MSNVFFTSDTHYGHPNIVKGISNWEDKSTCRDFQTIEEMNQVLVDNINRVVKRNDILYHLGDWSLGGADNIGKFAMQLDCGFIHLILGNHDNRLWQEEAYERKYFQTVQGLGLFKLNHTNMTLCHFALRTWYKQNKGAWMLYGHSHGNLPPLKVGMKLARTMDVGIDTHPEFRPYSFEEVEAIMHQRSQSIPDDYAG